MSRPLALRTATLALLLGALTPLCSPAQSSSPTEPLRDTVAFDRHGTVEVNNHNGSITVTTWDRSQIGYEVSLEPSDGDSVPMPESYIVRTKQGMAFGQRDSWSIEIPGLITISPSGSTELNGHYRIVMPTTAELEIDDHASTIEVSDVRADVSIDTYEGDVTVNGVEGFLELETYSGPAEATGIRGGVDLETYSGRITASIEEFSVSSSAETYSGPLRLFLPANTGFQLELDLDEEHLTVDEAFGAPSSSNEDRRVYNGGGPELELESSSGQIELRPHESRGTSSSP